MDKQRIISKPNILQFKTVEEQPEDNDYSFQAGEEHCEDNLNKYTTPESQQPSGQRPQKH